MIKEKGCRFNDQKVVKRQLHFCCFEDETLEKSLIYAVIVLEC